jgi:hypothetical protein
VTRDQWLAAFASAVGVEVPTDDDIEALLELAGIAAHASERTAAPITCWIAAVAGLAPADALRIAQAVRNGAD